jgi:sulfur transfer complex TusBCD TusB component (DsrH family)
VIKIKAVDFKWGKYDYQLTEKDVIVDTGAGIEIKGRISLTCTQLKMQKALFKKLLARGILEQIDYNDQSVAAGMKYYRISGTV